MSAASLIAWPLARVMLLFGLARFTSLPAVEVQRCIAADEVEVTAAQAPHVPEAV